MTAEMIRDLAPECRRQGYAAAKEELRRLLNKVPEEQMIGVVAAWLHEGDEDGRS